MDLVIQDASIEHHIQEQIKLKTLLAAGLFAMFTLPA